MPLVLAIEPDHRQAAIVKRIVRDKVLADVAVVDSRDAALEAMRKTVPDVLLLSTLLSPRDEDELMAHLRTLRDAEHLQTHTIPQLASSIGIDDDEKPRGLLSAFKRRKSSAGPTAGCDPELFADEIKTYLKRAADKKREVRTGPGVGPIVSPAASAPAAAKPRADTPEAGPESSWESPFEWRPSRSTRPIPPPDPEPIVAKVEIPIFNPDPIAEPEPAFEAFEPPIDLPASSIVEEPPAPRVKYPLTKRHARGWWYEEQERRVTEPDSELDAVLRSLAVPFMIAGIAYADGCRIRRVRLVAAD